MNCSSCRSSFQNCTKLLKFATPGSGVSTRVHVSPNAGVEISRELAKTMFGETAYEQSQPPEAAARRAKASEENLGAVCVS